jgi:hypothetical protein
LRRTLVRLVILFNFYAIFLQISQCFPSEQKQNCTIFSFYAVVGVQDYEYFNYKTWHQQQPTLIK